MITEKKLKKIGFKKKWFSDDSGYWFELKFKHKGIKLRLSVQTDKNREVYYLEVKVFDSQFTHEQYESLYKKPLLSKQFYKDLRTFKLI